MNFDETPHLNDFFVSTDKALLDVPFITHELKQTYWGSWMSLTTVMKAIDHSLCFGLYYRPANAPRDVQIGFARVITDYATFAWLCDVVVTKRFRGQRLGKFLIATAMRHPEVAPRSTLLCTKDAHGLYRKFGFGLMEAMKRTGGQS